MLKIQKNNFITTLEIDRPDRKNALNAELIQLLIDQLEKLNLDSETRLIIITGSENSFCAGADLNWLKDISHMNYDENLTDSQKFVELLNLVNNHNKPIISYVNGPAIGGGAGIALSSDIIIAKNDAFFGISEVGIGIIPAAIVPIVKKRIGETKTREHLITGERISAIRAYEYGMVNYIGDSTECEKMIDKLSERIINNGPNAVKKVREMIRKVDYLEGEHLDDYISETIAMLRMTDEAKEGIDAFLNKRKPDWK